MFCEILFYLAPAYFKGYSTSVQYENTNEFYLEKSVKWRKVDYVSRNEEQPSPEMFYRLQEPYVFMQMSS